MNQTEYDVERTKLQVEADALTVELDEQYVIAQKAEQAKHRLSTQIDEVWERITALNEKRQRNRQTGASEVKKWLADNFIRVGLFIILSIDAYGYFGWKGLMVWSAFTLFLNEQIHFIVEKKNETR